MPRDVRNRRSEKRQSVPRFLYAGVEVRWPDGKQRRLDLVDISPTDLCFAVAPGIAKIEKDTNLTDVRVQVGNFSFECHLCVLRSWRQFDLGYHYGARLYPKTESDQNELMSLIATLEANQHMGRSE
jgi:hypothetical protein